MKNLFNPTFRLSISLAGLTVSLLFAASLFGLLPNNQHFEIKSRAYLAESLAVQLSSAANENDIPLIRQTMSAVVGRNRDVQSIALRNYEGRVVVAAGDHDQFWTKRHDQKSSPTQVQVSIKENGAEWGAIEIAFAPLQSAETILGISKSILGLFAFFGVLGFASYYFVLRRALRELNPGNVIPERVKAAFNTLAEGVLILDEKGTILLANNSFAEALGKEVNDLFTSNVSSIKWYNWAETSAAADEPWRIVLREDRNVTNAKLGFRDEAGGSRIFNVNATCIRNESGEISGVLVTFDDVTVLERKNEELIRAVNQLQKSEEEITQQNRELLYLANHDPLSGCLNRRAFFEQFSALFKTAQTEGPELTCMMVDLDHFKRINDRFGHAVGDDVIAGTAKILREITGEDGIVGRYGGEEFCIALKGLQPSRCLELANEIRGEIQRTSVDWLGDNNRATSSIGLAHLSSHPNDVKEIVDWADQALYTAKETGRNKAVVWAEATTAVAAETEELPIQTPLAENIDTFYEKTVPDSSTAAISFAETPVSPETDALTKLPALSVTLQRANEAIAHAAQSGKSVAVLCISLDQVERLTALFGERAAKDLVLGTSLRFSNVLNRSDTVSLLGDRSRSTTLSRVSENKFLIVIPDLDETNMIGWVTERLFLSLKDPIPIHQTNNYVTANIGVSLFPEDGDEAELLVRKAQAAEHHAREMDGTNNVRFYSNAMNEASKQQLRLEESIRQAIEHDNFTLSYQPIVHARTGKVEALEALLRFKNDAFQGTPVGLVISVAEQTGLIVEMGEWITKAAIRQAEEWIDSGIDIPKISINLSAVQLTSKAAMEHLIQIIRDMRLPARKVQFEVTETAILDDLESAHHSLMRLQQLGVMIALDDFGTGQSSLSYLRRFRPDTLKVDRCFVDEIATSHADDALVSAIVEMAHRMGFRVVAEGVENKHQLDKLRQIGCDEIQGYYISRPQPASEMGDWLAVAEKTNMIAAAHKARPTAKAA